MYKISLLDHNSGTKSGNGSDLQHKVPKSSSINPREPVEKKAVPAHLSEKGDKQRHFDTNLAGAQQPRADHQQGAGYQRLGVFAGCVTQNPVVEYRPHRRRDEEDSEITEESRYPSQATSSAHHQASNSHQFKTATQAGFPVGDRLVEEIEFQRGEWGVGSIAGITGADLFSLSQARNGHQQERPTELETESEMRSTFDAGGHQIESIGQATRRAEAYSQGTGLMIGNAIKGGSGAHAPLSTPEQISGKKSRDLIQPLKDEYVWSPEAGPMNETSTMQHETLAGYPNTAELSTLIGERMYDDHLRGLGDTLYISPNIRIWCFDGFL